MRSLLDEYSILDQADRIASDLSRSLGVFPLKKVARGSSNVNGSSSFSAYRKNSVVFASDSAGFGFDLGGSFGGLNMVSVLGFYWEDIEGRGTFESQSGSPGVQAWISAS